MTRLHVEIDWDCEDSPPRTLAVPIAPGAEALADAAVRRFEAMPRD